jgi:hypothetical protein
MTAAIANQRRATHHAKMPSKRWRRRSPRPGGVCGLLLFAFLLLFFLDAI